MCALVDACGVGRPVFQLRVNQVIILSHRDGQPCPATSSSSAVSMNNVRSLRGTLFGRVVNAQGKTFNNDQATVEMNNIPDR